MRARVLVPSSDPANDAFFLVRGTGLIAFSTPLVSISRRPSSRKRELDTAIESDDLEGALAYAHLVSAALKTAVDGFLSIMQGAFQPEEPALPPGGGRR
jgi:hypothetical protein